jgi:hypothetical protein
LQPETGKDTQHILTFFGNIGNPIFNLRLSNNIYRLNQQNDSTRDSQWGKKYTNISYSGDRPGNHITQGSWKKNVLLIWPTALIQGKLIYY